MTEKGAGATKWINTTKTMLSPPENDGKPSFAGFIHHTRVIWHKQNKTLAYRVSFRRHRALHFS
jgi:hypothetical protein